MQRPFILFFLFLIACGPSSTSNREVVATTVAPARGVSTKTADIANNSSVIVDNGPKVADSSLYIGEIRTFPETGELYTPVYYLDDVNLDGLFESLSKQADSMVYEDNEIRRRRLPYTVARNFFNLSGLDSISVYKLGQLAGRAELVRVECFDDAIESQFVAVFKSIGFSILPDQLDYCISAGRDHYKTINVAYEDIEDEQLTNSLLEKFVPDSARVWDVTHTRITPYQSVYTAISLQSRLLLVGTTDAESTILLDLKEDWFISGITPLHLEINGKPVLLLTMGVNETDMIWTSLVVFSGEEYLFPENNRLKGF